MSSLGGSTDVGPDPDRFRHPPSQGPTSGRAPDEWRAPYAGTMVRTDASRHDDSNSRRRLRNTSKRPLLRSYMKRNLLTHLLSFSTVG